MIIVTTNDIPGYRIDAVFGEVMGQLFGLLAAGVIGPGRPTRYELAEGPKALAELEARATVGKLALLP